MSNLGPAETEEEIVIIPDSEPVPAPVELPEPAEVPVPA